jgi:hypothetical protein
MGMTAMEEKSSSSGGGTNGNSPEEKKAVRDHHPWDYHVSGPSDLTSPHWRDLICSSWYMLMPYSPPYRYRLYMYNMFAF